MLTVAFKEPTMSRTQVQLWYNRFKEGREDIMVFRARQQPMKTFSIIVESLLERLLKGFGI